MPNDKNQNLPAELANASPTEIEAYLASLEQYDERAKQFDINYFEKQDYIGVPFDITAVVKRIGGNVKRGIDDWIVTIRDRDTKEEGALTFDTNPSRDMLMETFQRVIQRYKVVPLHTLQELPQSDTTRSNPITIVPMARWVDLDQLEADRLAKRRARKRGNRPTLAK